MAYGGVAQTYCLWKLDGEPFKEKNAQYIYVLHPITKARKKVRWYTDKAHAEMMPGAKDKSQPLWKVFQFKDENDVIFLIRDKHLTEADVQEFFAYRWRHCVLFGGVWYAPTEMQKQLPERLSGKVIGCDWPRFKAEWDKHQTKMKGA